MSDPETPSRPESRTLVQRAQGGDGAALEELFAAHFGELRRWARGRLPAHARREMDTEDLVQDTFVRLYRVLEEFQERNEHAFAAYLRRIIRNLLQDQYRAAHRAPESETFHSVDFAEEDATPLKSAMQQERLDLYESSLDSLRPEERLAILLRIELGCSHQEVADALQLAGPDAARMRTKRALTRLANVMKEVKRRRRGPRPSPR